MSLPRLPNWGSTTSDGVLYELPTPALLTDARDGSASLPTPRAQNGEPRNMKPWVRPLDQPQNLENAIARLLPTPAAWDGSRGPDNSRLQGDGKRPSGQQGTLNLAGAIQLLTGDSSPSPLNDGNESSDAQRPHRPTTGNSQAGSSNG